LITGEKETVIEAGRKHEISVQYTPTSIGFNKSFISFEFTNCSSNSQFVIVRYISIRCGDPDDFDILKPNSAFIRKKLRKGKDIFSYNKTVYIEDKRKDKMQTFVNPLKMFAIPNYIREALKETATTPISDIITSLFCIKGDAPSNNESDPVEDILSKKLCMENYAKIFDTLLWVEEAQMEIDIKNYDMKDAILGRDGQSLYSLHVPGLAESRPSVLRGDSLRIKVNGGKCYQGYVTRIEQENVKISFHQSFDSTFIPGLHVDVRFSFSRMNVRLCHQALKLCVEGNVIADQIIFPESINNTRLLTPLNAISHCSQLKLYNRNLNIEQQTAVLGVLRSVARPSPYLIFGPPGTGKTVTLVEAILQTVRAKGSDPSFRVLVCAPSNAATDVIVERLSPYFNNPDEMIRILAFSRDISTVSSNVKKYTHFHEGGFGIPPVDVIKKKKIVAVTLASGGKLPNIGLKKHFTHVFMDEAGQAMEPEAICCLLDVTKASHVSPPTLVFAGDPKQLGPIIRSNMAKEFRLDQSLLERLCKRSPYQRTVENGDDENSTQLYDVRVMTKLVRNYRSHPAILELPNARFYDGDLIARSDRLTSHTLCNWEYLPKKNFPLIFHGVQGKDEREGNSPSWFNPEEAQLVKTYVDLLVKDTRLNKLKGEEIGVVTPYHKQAQKIRMLLRAHNYLDTKVGSVEEFQGSERRVIIISTVRSSVQHMDFDEKHKLGFVANSKRFNVAITRAQALLIVVGNPFVLQNDDDWKSFIHYSIENGGYTGCKYNDNSNPDASFKVLDEVTRGITSMNMNEDKDSEEDEKSDDFVMVSNVTAQEGPAWRSEE